jgi:polyisoprenoid-binding protein YceI
MEAEKEDFSDAKISFEADVKQYKHEPGTAGYPSKSDDFFNAEQFPKIIFVSKN